MAACSKCKRAITGADDRKRVEERKQPDGSVKTFGIGQHDGPVEKATGKIRAIYHYRCWFVDKKHNRMGPNGRYLDTSPTAYEMSSGVGRVNKTDMSPELQARRAEAERRYAEMRAKADEMAAKVAAGTATPEEIAAGREALIGVEQAESDIRLTDRQAEIEEQRAMEETPRAHTDWRDPTEADLP